MSSKAQIDERRRQVWDMLVRGVSKGVISKTLGVCSATITDDCKVLQQMHSKNIADIDVNQELGDAVAKLEKIFDLAMTEYSAADTSTQKAHFMEKALMAIKSKVQILSDTGVLPSAVKKTESKMVVEGLDIDKATLSELKTLRNRMLNRLDPVGN
jgi:hypothetical protein